MSLSGECPCLSSYPPQASDKPLAAPAAQLLYPAVIPFSGTHGMPHTPLVHNSLARRGFR